MQTETPSSENITKDNTTTEPSSIIGMIEIPILNIVYPILLDSTDELLRISPCRFYGPMPNQYGNLCIAGHNYDNNKFFSKINTLKKSDIITIYDINGFRY